MNSLESLLQQLKTSSENIEFDQVMSVITDHYDYTPSAFSNGSTFNDAGQNEGSCKIFAFARINGLSEQQTLSCFGKYYREDVLGNPDGDDHANIRQFIENGWSGINFETSALQAK